MITFRNAEPVTTLVRHALLHSPILARPVQRQTIELCRIVNVYVIRDLRIMVLPPFARQSIATTPAVHVKVQARLDV